MTDFEYAEDKKTDHVNMGGKDKCMFTDVYFEDIVGHEFYSNTGSKLHAAYREQSGHLVLE